MDYLNFYKGFLLAFIPLLLLFVFFMSFIFKKFLPKELPSQSTLQESEEKSEPHREIKELDRKYKPFFNIKKELKFIDQQLYYSSNNNSFFIYLPTYFGEYGDFYRRSLVEFCSILLNYIDDNIYNETVKISFFKRVVVEERNMVNIEIEFNSATMKREELLNLRYFLENKTLGDELFLKLQKLTNSLNLTITPLFEKDNLKINISFLSSLKGENKTLKLYKFKEIRAIVCLQKSIYRDFLEGMVKFFEVELLPKNDWESTKEHILNPYYSPDIIFLDAKTLSNSEVVDFLNSYHNEKEIVFVVICKNSNDKIPLLNIKYYEINGSIFYEDILLLLTAIKKGSKEQSIFAV